METDRPPLRLVPPVPELTPRKRPSPFSAVPIEDIIDKARCDEPWIDFELRLIIQKLGEDIKRQIIGAQSSPLCTLEDDSFTLALTGRITTFGLTNLSLAGIPYPRKKKLLTGAIARVFGSSGRKTPLPDSDSILYSFEPWLLRQSGKLPRVDFRLQRIETLEDMGDVCRSALGNIHGASGNSRRATHLKWVPLDRSERIAPHFFSSFEETPSWIVSFPHLRRHFTLRAIAEEIHRQISSIEPPDTPGGA